MTTLADDDRLGQDIELPGDPEATLPTTATGDLRLVSGYTNLRGALLRRAMTEPGAMLHRPKYGGGMPGYLERTSTPTRRAQLANAVRRNLLADGRLSDVKVIVLEGVVGDAGEIISRRGVTARIAAKIRDDDETLSASAAMAE